MELFANELVMSDSKTSRLQTTMNVVSKLVSHQRLKTQIKPKLTAHLLSERLLIPSINLKTQVLMVLSLEGLIITKSRTRNSTTSTGVNLQLLAHAHIVVTILNLILEQELLHSVECTLMMQLFQEESGIKLHSEPFSMI